jgi:hypothetical protein
MSSRKSQRGRPITGPRQRINPELAAASRASLLTRDRQAALAGFPFAAGFAKLLYAPAVTVTPVVAARFAALAEVLHFDGPAFVPVDEQANDLVGAAR